ncbi:MAG TPA: VOC family protein [Gryllotalpicola sp.]
MSAADYPSLVPELLVADLSGSIAFWCGLCGFAIDYRREDEGFASLSRGNAHVMLEQQGIGRNWITAPLDRPLGRGINFQITVPALAPLLASLRAAEHPLFLEPETKWYRISATEDAGVEQFLVADPDGYLIRFQAALGHRPSAGATG